MEQKDFESTKAAESEDGQESGQQSKSDKHIRYNKTLKTEARLI